MTTFRRTSILLLWIILLGATLLWATSYRWPCGFGANVEQQGRIWLTLPELRRGGVNAPIPNFLGPNLVQSSSGRLSIWHHRPMPTPSQFHHFQMPGVAFTNWTSSSSPLITGDTLWVSHWLIVGTSAAALLFIYIRRRLRPVPGHCPTCGYDLRASPDRCPECGATPQ